MITTKNQGVKDFGDMIFHELSPLAENGCIKVATVRMLLINMVQSKASPARSLVCILVLK